MEKKEEERSIEEQGESGSGNGNGNGGSVVEMEDAEVMLGASEIDFKPIEHPPEPPDDDRPIKCPIPDPLSLIVEEVFQEPSADSLQTIAQLLDQQQQEATSTEESTGGTVMESEKHHQIQTPLPEHANATTNTCSTTPAQKSPHQKLLQVFHQCKELHV